MSNIYVVPDAGGWSVKRGDASLSVIATHRRKDDAIAFAHTVASADGVKVVVDRDDEDSRPERPTR
jgi:hypothetical protein